MWVATILFIYLNGAGLEKELALTSPPKFSSQQNCMKEASKQVAEMVKITTDTVLVASFTCSKAQAA